jgi:hypothetical protein
VILRVTENTSDQQTEHSCYYSPAKEIAFDEVKKTHLRRRSRVPILHAKSRKKPEKTGASFAYENVILETL